MTHQPMTTTDWRERGVCRTLTDISIFFPRASNTLAAAEAALHCLGCEVFTDCLKDARDYRTTDGVVQAGAYWANGKPHQIKTGAALAERKLSRNELATIRRREAAERWQALLEDGHSAGGCYETVAREYGVSTGSVREWVRMVRAENRQRQNARDAV
jgi:hypothetical protein